MKGGHAMSLPHTRPGGPMDFFDTLFQEIGGLVLVNLLFLLTCLPVVTLGPALSSLARVTDDLARGRACSPCRAYWRWFRLRTGRKLLWGLAAAAAPGVLGFSLWFYAGRMSAAPLLLPLAALSLMGLLAALGVLIHLLPALAAAEDSPAALLRGAAGQAVTRLPRTLMALVLAAALLAAQVLVLPYSLPLVLALGASLPAFAANFVRLEHEEVPGDSQ